MKIMSRASTLTSLSLLFCHAAFSSDCSSEYNVCFNSLKGLVKYSPIYHSNDEHSNIILNDTSIYKAKTPYFTSYMDGDYIKENGQYFMAKTIISYSLNGACINELEKKFNCEANVILDFTGEKPLVSNEFFSDTGLSEIDWVSWGKLNSVVVFKDGSKFKYSKGHVKRVNNEED